MEAGVQRQGCDKIKANSFRYIIGIDLGTTQCALSFFDLEDREAGIQPFPIPQFSSLSEVSRLPTLPSVLFIPGNDYPGKNPPWGLSNRPVIGCLAHELGCEIPSRFIHSAKSWLCHPRIDRTSPILPWQSEAVAEKLSPVEVATWILRHLTAVWNHTMAGKDESAELVRQKVIITIPASFDPAARNLTLEAIKAAEIPGVTLLEEPQAAFYDFLYRNSDTIGKELAGVKTVLVIDIGGGTTDFSLIEVEHKKGSALPDFNRLAVGPHLLIGGDNIDLAIARLVDAKLKHKGKKLLTKQWLKLLNDSRVTKERIFSVGDENEVEFIISGAGSRVIGQTLREKIPVGEITRVILEGFFPRVQSDSRPDEEGALGLSEAGLPYSRDPAISKHLAAFLSDNNLTPDAVLFNGGTTLASAVRERLIENLTEWRKGKAPKILMNPHPTIAVSLGGTYFGMTGIGLGKSIKSGSPVSIYLGIGKEKGSAAANYVPEHLLCLLPKGSDTEIEYEIPGKTFGVDRSREVAFYLYFANSPPPGENPGDDAVKNFRKIRALPPLTLQADSKSPEVDQVKISVMLRETGFLEIFCRNQKNKLVQNLTFDVDPESAKKIAAAKRASQAPGKRVVSQIKKAFDSLFDNGHDRLPFNLVFKRMEEIGESPRKEWDIPFLRTVFDIIVDDKRFFTSNEALICYFRLSGYCLRPGFGATGDGDRLELVLPLLERDFESTDGAFWSEFWLLWKRIATGFSGELQTRLQEKIEGILFPPKKPLKGSRKIDQHEKNNIWRLLGNLERISPQEKERLGWWIIRSPATFGTDSVALFSVGRLGGRQMYYADQTSVISQKAANSWIETMLRYTKSENSYLDWALKEIGRKTGDRMVQIDDLLRKKIIDVLKKHNRKKEFLSPLLETQPLRQEDFAEFIGEALPSGFVWVKEH